MVDRVYAVLKPETEVKRFIIIKSNSALYPEVDWGVKVTRKKVRGGNMRNIGDPKSDNRFTVKHSRFRVDQSLSRIHFSCLVFLLVSPLCLFLFFHPHTHARVRNNKPHKSLSQDRPTP